MAQKYIRMLITQRGSPDGVTVNTYAQGEQYAVPDSLAEVFVRENWAEELKIAPPPETKDETAKQPKRVRRPTYRSKG